MPGLSIIISKQKREICEQRLREMISSLKYEEFYNSGIYSNPEASIYVGWTCHPKSFSDCLPATNRAKDLILFFAGEVYMDEDSSKIEENESSANTAKRLIRLYEEYGEKFFEKLNGLFCGLLLDTRRGKTFLFNDRYGLHRIFVHECSDGLYLSSEAKALLAILPETRNFDPKGVGEFLACGSTLGNRSLYKDVNILPPASMLLIEQGEVKKKGSYFDSAQWVHQEHLDEKQFSYKVEESFIGIAKRYFRGFLPIGISLTGGLDSRMVMACLSKIPGEFPCYTFGSMYRDTFDVKVAREVANACGQTHSVLVLGEEFIHDFPNYLEKAVYISDGYLGMSGAAELYVNSLAREIAPIRLGGNYGGELLRGHQAFKCEIPKGDFIDSDLHPYLHEAQRTFRELESTDAVTFALFKQAPLQGYGRRAIERSQVIPRTPFMDNDLVNLIYQAPPHLLKSEDISVTIVARYNPYLLEIATDRGLLGFSSLYGRATRQAYRKALIKAEYWSSHGMPNWLAAISRNGFGGSLEKAFLGRDKFQHFRLWSRKYFAAYITDVILYGSEVLKEFFNWRQVEVMVREHLSGRQNFINEIDKIMTLSTAHRILFKSASF